MLRSSLIAAISLAAFGILAATTQKAAPSADNPQGSVDAFRHVTEIDPNDADSWYFLGAASAQLKQYPQAIDAFQHALKLNPLHASAEFGIARAYQQSGDAAQAREHLLRFQHITQ